MRALHVRLLLLLAGLLLPTGALFVLASLNSARGYHQEITQRRNLALAANLVAQSELMAGDALPRDALGELVKMLAMTNPGVEIYLLDAAGRVMGAPPGVALARDAVALTPIERFLALRRGAAEGLPILGDDPRRGGRAIFSAAPLPGAQGFFYVVLTDEAQASLARRLQASTTLRLTLWGTGSALLLLLLVGALASALLTRRLRRLGEALRAFRLDPDEPGAAPPPPPPPRLRDDIDELQQRVSELALRARAQFTSLTRSDRERRDLVTNISHDLRTPLAALQGYLEVLEARGEELPPTTRASYLAAARRNAVRLDRLVDQLFELSRLERAEQVVRRERFPLAELVSDALQKVALDADGKGIALALEAPPRLPFVVGDLGLVERALSNLLDNALRHTPPGGRVKVTLEPLGGEVRVSVADSGPGIAAEDRERIFERFYRAEQGRSGAGSGLGLAIVRRIVELHGGRVAAREAAGGGALLSFTLPQAPAVAGAADAPAVGR